MSRTTIGLLPLYLKLYDDTLGSMRTKIEHFYNTIAEQIRRKGISVITTPVCRLEKEFEAAIERFEAAGASAVVTLHLAYSPSLESSRVLARTRLPIIVLDTTPSYSYGPTQNPDELLYNHGIHGVQDMCNLLLRNRKPFFIEAGHWEKSDVLERVVRLIRAAAMADRMKHSRTGLIGDAFKGMGDFAVSPQEIKASIGTEIVRLSVSAAVNLCESVLHTEVREELEADKKRFRFDSLSPEVHERSVRIGLAVRKWLEKEKLSAFSFNFMDITKASGLETVPFLEASKAMSRRIGYAGEGDVLTATLVGTIAGEFEQTSFTEMFCPDWENDLIYLSHMGEMNYLLASETPKLIEMNYPYTDAENPVVAVGRFKPGKIFLIDVAPLPENRFRLILVAAEMTAVTGSDAMGDSVHGWFKPGKPIREFSKEYSMLGGTHHLALVYDCDPHVLQAFAAMMGWDCAVL